MSFPRLLMTLAGLGLACAPLGIALAALSGIGHRWTDILAQFVAPALIGAFVLALVLLALRLKAPAGVAVLAVVLLGVAVWPQAFPESGPAADDAATTRLYFANLWARNQDLDAMTASIAAADADIVVLVELGDAPAAALDRILPDHPHRASTPRVDRPHGAVRSLIASRRPLEPLPLPPSELEGVAARVDTPAGPITVMGVHLTRPWPFQYQWGQIRQVMALAEARTGVEGPLVVAGDFNAVSSARIGRQVREEVGLIPAPAWPGTWPSALPSPLGMTIDHVWRSPDLALTSRRLGRPTGSDHRPVIVDLATARQEPALIGDR